MLRQKLPILELLSSSKRAKELVRKNPALAGFFILKALFIVSCFQVRTAGETFGGYLAECPLDLSSI